MSALHKIKYVYGICRTRANQGHASVLRQILEILFLRITTGISYATYHYAAMWAQGCRLDL